MAPLKKVLHLEADPRKKPLYDVVDVGAGSGKLTRALQRLLPAHTTLAAVESSVALRSEFQSAFPSIPVIEGSSSSTRLPSESVGNITVGQAIQCAAERNTLDEFHRILVPNGRLGVVWNSVDLSETPFMHEVDKILKSYNILKPEKATSEARRLHDCFIEKTHLFTPLESVRIPIVHTTTVDAVVDYLLTLSVVESLPHRKQTDIRLSIARLIESRAKVTYDGERKFVDLPCLVEMFWCTKRPLESEPQHMVARVMSQ
ncbi:hypothetical protein SPRG_04179 [Saprolegnia parasitica CBS 223.65]|uniref:Methyltransferase type 11 domain-containing protein n=1 Tax=Saprolegnia parasitica (strain CBS 223.65) TaxID=695850 RepID=A0A067CWR6_SAPPC|nr:hypothetical protein SPRG_04179 [Saprolegnia parasitica CBS 223.65]KDO30991.1 hypothetical protein SPRG_04179 [Saprolegnia parasitica CBS 223.65]|eukprot:XP_012198175.1 hypothetical protein SPRG_04179 [Saprolegnia parasitica CBS 223.65]